MIVFTSRDNRFTRFVQRNGHRLAGATVCRIRGHRHSRYIWGACDRCCQFYDRPLPTRKPAPRLAPEWQPDPNGDPPDRNAPIHL